MRGRIVSALAALWFVAWTASGCSPEESPDPSPADPAKTDEALDARRSSAAPEAKAASQDQEALLEELLALGYLEGSKTAHEEQNVTLYDRERAFPGLNLLVSGHGPEAILFDMEGRIIHRWHYAYKQAWPDSKKQNWFRGDRYWRRAHIYPNGDALAIFDGLGMIKVDKDSNIIWRYHNNTHHDIDVRPNGLIYSLAHFAKVIPRIHESNLVLEDFIVIVNPKGQELRRISLYSAVANSKYEDWLDDARDTGDIFHTNTIEVFDGRLVGANPLFRRGNVLVSIHGLNAIGIVDPRVEKLVWGMQGPFMLQHQPTLLENGNLLVFDNLGGKPKHSRVIELDFVTGEIVWNYEADDADAFYTFCCGSSQRLPNGNTLISDTDGGAAFEVTNEKEMVWRYQSPYRAGEEDELVASLFEVVRLPADFPVAWANFGQVPESRDPAPAR